MTRRRRSRIAAVLALVLIPVGHGPASGALVPDANQRDLRSGHVLVANQQSANVSLIDLRDDSSTSIEVGTGPHEAVIAPSGRVGVVTIYGGQVPGNQLAVIDIAGRRVVRTISLGDYTRPHGAWFLPGDETRVVVTSETTRHLVIVDIANGVVEGAIPTGAAVSHMVAVAADGKRAFTANIGSGSVSELNLETRTLVRTIDVAPNVEGIAVVPDASAVWAGSNTNGTVSVIDTRTGGIVATIDGVGMPYRIAISADGRVVAICDPKTNRLHVADVAARKVVWTLDGLPGPRGVNIAPNGRLAFVTLAGTGAVGVVDLEARKLTRTIPVGTAPDGVWYGPAPAA